jgi:hypothetical protein
MTNLWGLCLEIIIDGYILEIECDNVKLLCLTDTNYLLCFMVTQRNYYQKLSADLVYI